MSYIQEIDDCLKIIRSLEESFQVARGEGMLYLSFFSENHDRVNQLKSKLNNLEALQLRYKEQQEEFENELTHSQNDLPPECDYILDEKESFIQPDETHKELITSHDAVTAEPYSVHIDKEITSTTEFLAETINRKIFTDIQSSLTLNDRFRFQRDLFQGNQELMNETLIHLNNLDSITDVLDYLTSRFSWDWGNESVQAFNEILEKKFS